MSMINEIDYGTPASRSDKLVTLTIDGMAVSVPEGTSIMRAAMEAGTKIPKLCASDMLESFGSCRLCLVEIEGRAGTPASCTTPVLPGMVVHTQTNRLKELRRGVMELYISDHPLDCLTCAANCRPRQAPSACARCAAAMMAPTISRIQKTNRTPISATIHRSALSVTAASAPVRRCKARSR